MQSADQKNALLFLIQNSSYTACKYPVLRLLIAFALKKKKENQTTVLYTIKSGHSVFKITKQVKANTHDAISFTYLLSNSLVNYLFGFSIIAQKNRMIQIASCVLALKILLQHSDTFVCILCLKIILSYDSKLRYYIIFYCVHSPILKWMTTLYFSVDTSGCAKLRVQKSHIFLAK